jgi:pyruvate oxidase
MVKSGLAMLNVLKSWGVDHLYGIPGGSINSTMDALYEMRDSIRYIQVRHEEVGALAAAADAKLTGKVGVCFGSAGPGATHLFNGLYDAQMDHAPVLAIVGQVAHTAMNYDAFQEMNENPMFADVSVYNRTVMSPESLPKVVDEAIRRALAAKGVAVVTIPVDYGFVDIPDDPVASAASHRQGYPVAADADISRAVELIKGARNPVLYAGQGARGAGKEVVALSDHYSLPIVMSVLAKGIIPDAVPAFMGMAARVATKPANEALAASDLIVFVGSDFPFARIFFPKTAKLIQIDANPARLGARHPADVAILADAGEAMRRLREAGTKREPTAFYKACLKNRANWMAWLRGFEDHDDVPLRAEPVFKEINRIAKPDAIFVTDVGNSTIHAIRLLDMNGGEQRFTTSGMFATMGYGVPGGIAAKLSYPERQVFTLSGDGAFAMVMQDVITQVRYRLPIINVVFSNDSLGFIEAEQEDTGQPYFGIDLSGADYAKAAEAMGARGISVSGREQLASAFDAARDSDIPVVIDVKLENKRPFPAEAMVLDPSRYGVKEIDAFKKRYEVTNMPALSEILRAEGGA